MEENLNAIQEEGIPRDENDIPKIESISRLNNYAEGLSAEDFENTEIGAIVPTGMDNSGEHSSIESAQVETDNWNSDELKSMYKIARQISPW
ncbi:hypothetical protein G3I44_06895 [Halogeometricum borinquense]|uniref:Uncharacterized protein n=1 Tax=Halogeometricum borinquense TaxID=60847 RepID=A0A6C0UC14_9EURY|nr:hypothetical protein [Halogeometricum borinquense]QIB72792.1 hypothetical protein G3I44_06895 [Halogeometricum borinquense]